MTDSDRDLMQGDLKARRDGLDVSRSFIVQAPAGSGKTELLIQRYLSLLGVVGEPEEILAITFTRKASAEMQLRVLDSLRKAQSGAEPNEAHERLTYRLASAALRRSTELEWHLLSNPRRMRIQTLDALNAAIARAKPMSAPESASGARVVVGVELRAIQRAAAVATLDWLAESGEMQEATREVLQHVDNNTGLYVSYLSQMLATRDQWLPFVGSGSLSGVQADELRRRFEDSLEFAVRDQLERVANHFSDANLSSVAKFFDYAAENLLKDGVAGNPVSELRGLTVLPEAEPRHLPAWQGVAELLLTQKDQFRKKVDKRQGFPAGGKDIKDRLHELLAALVNKDVIAMELGAVRSMPPVRYSDEQWNVLLALFRLLPLAVVELKRLFGEQGITDHTEIALSASEALGSAENPGDIALLLDYQVRHLLVDEMQDTSIAQYRMLEALTGGWEAGDGRSLFCVGDPMQSIYRFRNAEVGQFLLARESGIGHLTLEPLLLRRNFRSGSFLVDWFNTVFPQVLADSDDALRGAVRYSEAVSADHLEGLGDCVVHPVFGAEADTEAQAGAEVIQRTLDEFPDDDMVVLVRGRSQLPELLANLRAANIAYRAVEIDRLTDLPEIIEVTALARAAAHQGDRVAWLGILRAPWIGLSWSDLHALVRNDKHSTVWELLQKEARLTKISAKGRDAIERARDILGELVRSRRAETLRDLVERTWITLGGAAMRDDSSDIENVYRFFDVLAKLERAGSLLDVAELEAALDLEHVSRTEDARLQIMTMHKAKGLQFDHVLLFGLGRMPGRGDRNVLSWYDIPGEHGREQKIVSPVGPRAEVDNDPVHRYIELADRQKDNNEQARLLYVACTRARKSLHLMGNTAVSTDGETFRPPRSDSLLYRLWQAVEPQFEAAFESYRAMPATESEEEWAYPQLKRLEPAFQLPVADPLPGIQVDDALPPESREVEFYWVGNEARIAGTLVHRWLQRLTDDPVALAECSEAQVETVSLRWLKELGLEADAAEGISTRIVAAVVATLDEAKGRWLLAGEGHAELELSGVIDDEIVSVVLDRVCIDEDGTHWIVDYKTSTHEGGNLEGFIDAEISRYRPQLARYAALYGDWAQAQVRSALYFPLLGRFAEVEL
ncbi:MAG: UvrD-helicase domain-containing protein [Gammaproteobacteria bacterium]|nr:UvrD-helicase domain-containing protein [Gammaproteobacteria bacterium]